MAHLGSQLFKAEVIDADEPLHRSVGRISLHPDVLKAAKVPTGSPVALCSTSRNAEKSFMDFAVGTAWPCANISPDTMLVSQSLARTSRVVHGQEARLIPLAGQTLAGLPDLRRARDAAVVHFVDASHAQRKTPTKTQDGDWLPLLLREISVDLKYIHSRQLIEVAYEGERRCFAVSKISTSTSVESQLASLGLDDAGLQIWKTGWNTEVKLVDNVETVEKTATLQVSPSHESYTSVGGLAKQIDQIRDLLELPLTRPELFRHFNLKPPRGILLHGPPGTGKTHLARAVAASTKASVLVINGPELSSAFHGETESKLRDVFKEAHTKSPCVIILDEVDALVPRREEGSGGEVEKRVVATLLTLLDGIESDASSGLVIVIGTTNRPNAIDPALRRPGRFDREIEVGVPDIEGRVSILRVLLAKSPHSLSDEDLLTISSRAHGYVGADLGAVVREAGTISIKRHLLDPTSPLEITLSDLMASLPSIRPSAMRSIFVEAPPVHYADIGGQADVIKKLRESVEWPLRHPEAFQRLGVKPPKGVLLYGPPGCSKTVMARACACESGVNFVAVKGPELLNKFVGESERAVREIFRKARAVSPSIIFFDEIDALATSRTASEDGAGSSHEGVLTSLLNEMDGVQELVGVTIIAATNRPESMDSALMRPGRLDRILYVGPPDVAGRKEILRIRTNAMRVDPELDLDVLADMTAGCSGAEISALCQEAALLTMQENMDAASIPQHAFVTAAKSIKRQITPAVLAKYERWRIQSGVQ
ncbi:AAA family ATPase [Cylindrobasidium torrendii FP15055 ss-10]|uniref:AAA family ATPase n=1 Tax=Cylindrobasidium torrendii FP15055 ss-10 TaxID=1314674 RepID=A0A0D7B7H9_9AGAR|nr:AAA family ATPase [Cylindrobasidium torrendii FP15055 ss-10]